MRRQLSLLVSLAVDTILLSFLVTSLDLVKQVRGQDLLVLRSGQLGELVSGILCVQGLYLLEHLQWIMLDGSGQCLGEHLSVNNLHNESQVLLVAPPLGFDFLFLAFGLIDLRVIDLLLFELYVFCPQFLLVLLFCLSIELNLPLALLLLLQFLLPLCLLLLNVEGPLVLVILFFDLILHMQFQVRGLQIVEHYRHNFIRDGISLGFVIQTPLRRLWRLLLVRELLLDLRLGLLPLGQVHLPND